MFILVDGLLTYHCDKVLTETTQGRKDFLMDLINYHEEAEEEYCSSLHGKDIYASA